MVAMLKPDNQRRRPTVEEIVEASRRYYGLNRGEIESRDQTQAVTLARMMVYVIASSRSPATQAQIGTTLQRSNSTISTSIMRMRALMRSDKTARDDHEAINAELDNIIDENEQEKVEAPREIRRVPEGGNLGSIDTARAEERLYGRVFVSGFAYDIRFPFEVMNDISGQSEAIMREDEPLGGFRAVEWTPSTPVLIVRLLRNDGSPV